ncbi:hypothetical protein N0V88_007037 [Collariella sp. IMI 366227]|nr:hypothetical protein N0V88_007037 [Collariella sp. IMI 366227]
MRPESHEHHILLNGVTPKCDICHNKLDPTEKIVALAGDKSTTFLHKGFLDPFGTETWEQQRQHKVLIDEKWRLCRVEEYVCHAFHGFQVRRHGCAFHEGCLQVFMRNYNPEQRPGEMLDRLWQACVWARVPWTGVRVPELGLWPATRSSWTCLGVFLEERYDNKAFVIEEERKLGVAVVHVKNGRLQLAVLNDIPEPELSVWDTPTPPDLSRCLFQTLCSGDFTACRFKPNWHDPTYNETENNNYAFLLADPGIPPTTLIYSNGPPATPAASPSSPHTPTPTPNPPTQKSITVLAAPPHYPSPEKYQFWEHSDAQLQNVHRAWTEARVEVEGGEMVKEGEGWERAEGGEEVTG